MKYLIISNKGEIPLWGMTHIGISEARGEKNKIGQFGSGAKHGILVALRAGLKIKIFSGLTEIIPAFEKMESSPEHEELVFYIDNVKRSTSLTKGFGEIDWQSDVSLALREFFSNAIDQGESAKSCYEISEEVRAQANKTQVIIPYTGKVDKFIRNLDEWYVPFNQAESFQPHTSEKGLCYLKGVKIGKLEKALLNYNFEQISLNESRVVESPLLVEAASALIASSEDSLETIFRNIDKPCFETEKFNVYALSTYSSQISAQIVSAWKKVYGEAHPILQEDAKFFQKKNLPFKIVPEKWYNILTGFYVALGYNKEKLSLEKTYNFSPPTKAMTAMLDQGWEIIELVGLTNQKSKPEVFGFTKIMSEGNYIMGMYKDNKVYFNIDESPSLQTCLEELAHHCSEAGDETRDFQDYVSKLASRLALRL